MARSLLDTSTIKLQFSGHETFPLRYGWLKKAYDAVLKEKNSNKVLGSIFNDESAIAVFGVGKNMVLSIKHWAIASGILTAEDIAGERSAKIGLGALGDILFGQSLDPYLEHPGSLWLIHWMLASQPGRTTAWYWAFNEFHEPSFDRELMRKRLQQRCDVLTEKGRFGAGRAISDISIKRDVECLIRTYHAGSPGARRAPEDSIECPLSELGLIQSTGVGEQFRLRRGPKSSLPDAVFLYALISFWRNYHENRSSFSVEFLTFERGSPGQVFLLDEEAVAERLLRLDLLTDGAIRWDESSGMRQIYAHRLDSVDPWQYFRDMLRLDLKADAA
jgi:Protein of unknown function (DUF4007)